MRAWLFAAALGGALVLLAILDPHAAGAGWRAAFVIAGAVPAGAIALLLVARLTGAAWAPALLPFAAPAPLMVPALVGVMADQWLRPVPPHLAQWLSPAPFLLRGLMACALWWWLSRRLRGTRLGDAEAGVSLLAHAAALALVAPDWLLGVAPAQPFSAIAMLLGTGQIFAACAAVTLTGTGPAGVRRDLSHLMLAAGLGLGYFAYVDYLVVWYGNLPPRIGYYAVRTSGGWGVLALVALAVGIVLPTSAVAAARGLRFAGAAALLGWALLVGWLVLPGGGAWGVAAAALALALVCVVPVRRTA